VKRSYWPLGLVLLLAPALSAAAEPERVAEPKEVIVAFADLCIMAADVAAEDAAAKERGGTPITVDVPADSPPGRHFDLKVDEVLARVGFSDSACMLMVDAVDVPATAAMLEDFLTHVFDDTGISEAQDDRPLPPGSRKVRDIHLAKPGDTVGMRLTVLAVDHPGSPTTMMLMRNFEAPDARARAATPKPAETNQ